MPGGGRAEQPGEDPGSDWPRSAPPTSSEGAGGCPPPARAEWSGPAGRARRRLAIEGHERDRALVGPGLARDLVEEALGRGAAVGLHLDQQRHAAADQFQKLGKARECACPAAGSAGARGLPAVARQCVPPPRPGDRAARRGRPSACRPWPPAGRTRCRSPCRWRQGRPEPYSRFGPSFRRAGPDGRWVAGRWPGRARLAPAARAVPSRRSPCSHSQFLSPHACFPI